MKGSENPNPPAHWVKINKDWASIGPKEILRLSTVGMMTIYQFDYLLRSRERETVSSNSTVQNSVTVGSNPNMKKKKTLLSRGEVVKDVAGKIEKKNTLSTRDTKDTINGGKQTRFFTMPWFRTTIVCLGRHYFACAPAATAQNNLPLESLPPSQTIE